MRRPAALALFAAGLSAGLAAAHPTPPPAALFESASIRGLVGVHGAQVAFVGRAPKAWR